MHVALRVVGLLLTVAEKRRMLRSTVEIERQRGNEGWRSRREDNRLNREPHDLDIIAIAILFDEDDTYRHYFTIKNFGDERWNPKKLRLFY